MEISAKKNWDYTLKNEGNEYFFIIVCGSVGRYEVEIQFSNEQKERYFEKGSLYLEELAKKIRIDEAKKASNKSNLDS